MIVVKLELWPGGDASRAQDLGKAVIANESDLADLSTYSVRLLKGAKYSARPGTLYKSGTVRSFPRRDRRWGPWELLALALEATVGDRIEELKRYVRARLPARCVCGQLLPIHLADLGLTDHVCSCERSYRVEAGVFVPNGIEPNPFAQREGNI